MDVKQEQETGLVVSEKGKGQSYNFTDQELIRQLVKSRIPYNFMGVLCIN